jgi:hypothetical protein
VPNALVACVEPALERSMALEASGPQRWKLCVRASSQPQRRKTQRRRPTSRLVRRALPVI